MTQELPVYLQANHGINPNGNAVVGSFRWRQRCSELCDLLPAEVHLRLSLSGFLNPSEGWWPMLIGLAMNDAGGFNAQSMWGPSRRIRRGGVTTRWSTSTNCGQQHPVVDLLRHRHAVRILDTSGGGGNLVAAQFLEGFTLRTNKTFMDNYLVAGY